MHLSEPVIAILKSIPQIASNESVNVVNVFTTNGRTPISGFSKAKAQLNVTSGVTNWRFHDIRRTVVTQMAAFGVSHHVADAILNHKSGAISGVAAVYQQHEFLLERRHALEEWGARLVELIKDE